MLDCSHECSIAAVPNLFGTRDQTGPMEDNFSMDEGGEKVLGWLKCLTFIVHLISIIISASPQIIRH